MNSPRSWRMARRRGQSRGQSLVVLSLTALLLTLMVTVTLEVGMRTKRRMEAQMLADASAFNQAVATARAFNQVALVNRASAATWVSLAATQSLISWAGGAYGHALVASILVWGNYQGPQGAWPGGKMYKDKCMKYSKWDDLSSLDYRIQEAGEATWKDLDAKAGARALADQGVAASYPGLAAGKVAELGGAFASQAMAQKTIAAALPDGRDPFSAGNGVNAVVPHGDGSMTDDLYVVMGSRGDTFVRNRPVTPIPLDLFGLRPTQFSLNVIVPFQGGGGAGFGPLPTGGNAPPGRHKAQERGGVNGLASWGEDDVTTHDFALRLHCFKDGKDYDLYSAAMPAIAGWTTNAYVASTDQYNNADAHRYYNFDGDYYTTAPPETEHTLRCGPYPCKGVFGGFYNYDSGVLESRGRVYGQPVMSSVIKISNRTLKQPWQLDFRYEFRAGHTEHFQTRNAGGAEQAAVSSSVAYYHRAGHPNEPPNFFNPFWRATLVTGRLATNVPGLMGANGLGTQQTAAQLLINAGYKGY